ncbi:uncharacterized protein BDR25DRAFT_352179 [Lindgomyces ingoldianus]|uniref:Uncharacterized protein n=1 Tax=Lindgomyces ingoldianus TaxID=673940 RepID=A0ACB6R4K0_9PLEO|nr:uncharacterized protein BDR25DRAFT_352179 [Lindgomyces ingoldianus]KAF2473695.1 hypothetical protein BDR25DRAFT_352179 [Lindgomyces ingoldianus]
MSYTCSCELYIRSFWTQMLERSVTHIPATNKPKQLLKGVSKDNEPRIVHTSDYLSAYWPTTAHSSNESLPLSNLNKSSSTSPLKPPPNPRTHKTLQNLHPLHFLPVPLSSHPRCPTRLPPLHSDDAAANFSETTSQAELVNQPRMSGYLNCNKPIDGVAEVRRNIFSSADERGLEESDGANDEAESRSFESEKITDCGRVGACERTEKLGAAEGQEARGPEFQISARMNGLAEDKENGQYLNNLHNRKSEEDPTQRTKLADSRVEYAKVICYDREMCEEDGEDVGYTTFEYMLSLTSYFVYIRSEFWPGLHISHISCEFPHNPTSINHQVKSIRSTIKYLTLEEDKATQPTQIPIKLLTKSKPQTFKKRHLELKQGGSRELIRTITGAAYIIRLWSSLGGQKGTTGSSHSAGVKCKIVAAVNNWTTYPTTDSITHILRIDVMTLIQANASHLRVVFGKARVINYEDLKEVQTKRSDVTIELFSASNFSIWYVAVTVQNPSTSVLLTNCINVVRLLNSLHNPITEGSLAVAACRGYTEEINIPTDQDEVLQTAEFNAIVTPNRDLKQHSRRDGQSVSYYGTYPAIHCPYSTAPKTTTFKATASKGKRGHKRKSPTPEVDAGLSGPKNKVARMSEVVEPGILYNDTADRANTSLTLTPLVHYIGINSYILSIPSRKGSLA